MQNNVSKPVLVPTTYSLRVVLWSLALVALFGALMWAYCAYGALGRAREQLALPVQAVLDMPLFRVKIPPAWEAYSKAGDALALFRKKGSDIPIIYLFAERDPGYPYHALDVNPAIVFQVIEEDIREEPLEGIPSDVPMRVIGSEQFTVRPGISAVRILFDIETHDGEAVLFYAGDVRYVLWALWRDKDKQSREEVRRFFRHLFEDFDIPEMRESIDRPVVHSGRFTAELNGATHLRVKREMALWQLFAARAEAEPDVALLPALQHYREALRLLSSIRQERMALASDEFKLYKKLLEKRQRDVEEWFVVLDKAVAMRDWTKARAQAKWIMSHATLTGERMDVRRAADILATKIPSEDGGGKGKK